MKFKHSVSSTSHSAKTSRDEVESACVQSAFRTRYKLAMRIAGILGALILLMGVCRAVIPAFAELTNLASEGQFSVSVVDLEGNSQGMLNTEGFDLSAEPKQLPQKESWMFVRAFLGDNTNTQQQTDLLSAKLSDDKTQVILELEAEHGSSRATLSLAKEDASKIKVQMYSVADYATITYNNQISDKATLSGAERVKLDNGSAIIKVSANTPTDEEPQLSAGESDGAEVSVSADLSSSNRKILQYNVKVTKDTTLTLTSRSTTSDTYTATFDTSRKNDWADDDLSTYTNNTTAFQHFNDIYQVNSNNIYQGQSSGNSTTVQSGETLKFKVYHDRGNAKLQSGATATTTQLAALWINGQTYPAPQPFSRYGKSMYEDYCKAPLFENISFGSANTSWKFFTQQLLPNSLLYFIPNYTEPHGFTSPLANGSVNNSNWQEWMQKAILGAAVGSKTITRINSGPLAGSTVTITLTDAQPFAFYKELGTGATFSVWNYKDGTNKNQYSGFSNSLRLCYEVEITDVTSNLQIAPEWVASTNMKLGVYFNYGVESMQIKASKVNDKESNLSAIKSYVDAGTSAWVDCAAFEGASGTRDNIYTEDPKFDFKATIKNGYVDPRYYDASWFVAKQGLTYKDVLSARDQTQISYTSDLKAYGPRLKLQKTSDQTQVTGSYPIFTVGSSKIRNFNNSEVIRFGGMSTVGVRASLAHIGAWYDLNGGTSFDMSLYPSKDEMNTILSKVPNNSNDPNAGLGQAASFVNKLYNVESRPLVVVPATPVNNETSPLIAWELILVKADGTEESTGRYFQPGEILDISSESALGSRITSTAGDLLIKAVGFKATYNTLSGSNIHTYTVKCVSDDGSVLQEFNFLGSEDLTATLQETDVPQELESSGKRYRRSLSESEVTAALSTTLTAGNTTPFTFTYTETTAEPIIPKSTTQPTPPSDNYVTITFNPNGHGTIPETTPSVFFVDKTAGKTYADLKDQAPTPTNLDKGYTFKEWTYSGAAVQDAEQLDQNKTFTADYNYAGDFIAKTNDAEPAMPADYVTVTFTADSVKGTLSGDGVYGYYVNPDKAVSFSQLTAPTVSASVGYEFSNTWKKADGEVIVGADTITQNLILSAEFTELPSVSTTPQTGYVTVTFAANLNEADLTGATIYYVKPNVGITLGDSQITKPTVEPKTGYRFDSWDKQDNTPITDSNLTVNATCTALQDVVASADGSDNNKPANYVTIEFTAGSHGSFADPKPTTKFFVNPEKQIKFSAPQIAQPTIQANTGYSFRAWTYMEGTSRTDTTDTLLLTKDYVFEADYGSYADIVPLDVPSAKPANYYLITFVIDGEKGQKQEADKLYYAVHPDKAKTLAEVTHPNVTANTGYEFAGWDKDSENNQPITGDLTVTAEFTTLADIIAKDTTHTQAPSGYVTITFSEGAHGHFAEGATCEFFVNPSKNKTYEDLKTVGTGIPTPERLDTGYSFANYTKADNSPVSDMDLLITTQTFTAAYTELAGVVLVTEENPAPEGYLLVNFAIDSIKGKAEDPTKLVYAVNPNKTPALTLSDVDHPTVISYTGYKFSAWDDEDTKTDPITQNITVTAQFDEVPAIVAKTGDEGAPAGYITITFASGTQGSFEADAATVFYVNPNKNKSYKDLKEHTPSAPLPTKINTGYTFTHYTKADGAVLTDDESLTTTQTFTAAYSYAGDVIAKDADHPTNPGGYVLVSFTADSDKGSVSGASEYWVNPNGNVSFGTDALKAPEVVANTGYSFSGSWLKDDNTVITTGTVITKALTLSADLTKLPDVTTEQQAGYVAVSFAASPSEKATLTGTTTYYVNPSAHVTLGNALIVKPEVTPHTGYSFNGTWSVGDETEITSPLTVLANLSELPSVVASPDGTDTNKPSDYVSISFSSGANGSFKDSRATTKFFVNPDKALTFDAQEITKPEVTANTGYAFRAWTYKEGDETKDATSALILTKDYMVEADYTKLQDVVPVTTDTPAPAGYVLVNFVVDTNKATTTDALQYAVNPNADPQVLLKDVPHPTLTAKTGFKLNGWDNQDLEDKAVTANITLTAQFTAYADVIALSDAEPSAPNGYVTIRFTEGTNGSFATDAPTTFFVNPEASPKATLSALKAAGLQDPKASLGYAFKGWRIVKAEPATDASATRVRRSAAEGEPDAAPASPENSVVPENSDTIYLSDDSSYELVADTTFEAVYTELKDVFASTEISSAPEGYATVTFKVDADKGTVAENAPTVFYVNPTKAVSVGSLAPSVTPKADYFYTGWDTKDDTTVTENLTVEAQFVKKNSASYTPEAKEVTIHKGDALDAQDTIANAADLPNDTSFSFDGEIDTTAVGTQEVTVKVTYPDKTEDTVRVTITVKDKQPLTPIVVFPDNIRVKEGDPVIVYVGDDLLTDEYMDKFKEKFENLPDGAKVSFVDGPHTNEDGTSYVRIKVEVDGISKTFKVPVDPRNTTAWAEITPVPAVSVKDGAVEVYVGDDLSTEDYMAKFKDKLENLPDNASVSFVDGPNTAEDGSSSVRIRVTVDGASKIVEIPVTLLTRPVPPAPEPEPEPQPEPAPKPSDDTDTPQDATGSKDSAQDTSDAKANNTKERQVPKTSDSTPTILTTLLLGVGTVLLAVQKLLTRRSVH